MSNIIKEYYFTLGLPPVVVEKNIDKLTKNQDILKEFEYWITNREYVIENPVEIEGYTADSLSKLSRFIDGESVFMLLVELRENPEKAKKTINRGFKIK